MLPFGERLSRTLDPVEGLRPADLSGRLVPAAVVVPVVVNEDDPAASEVLLTLRTESVRDHKGQVSFPGGVFEEKDGNLVETALRETREETGIGQDAFVIAGRLKEDDTITGYRIHPFVGILSGRPDLAVNRVEIEKVFYVPIGFFLDPSHVDRHEIIWEGRVLFMDAFKWEGMVIWGATFRILIDLAGRIGKLLERFNGK